MSKYAEGTNYTKALTPDSTNLLAQGVFGGKLRCMQDQVTFNATGGLKSQRYIVVGDKLPIGAIVTDIAIGLVPSGTIVGTTRNTVQVGDEGDWNRYMTSVQLSAGFAGLYTANPTQVRFGPDTATTGMYYTVTGVTDNYIRITGLLDNTLVTTGTLKVSVMYVVE